MQDEFSIDNFISSLAHKIAALYPNNCADEEDYIQAGHLKLIEINDDAKDKRSFLAYAIVAISRAMRDTALGAMGATSAPGRVKKLVHRMELLFSEGHTEFEIQKELGITSQILSDLKTLSDAYSLSHLFNEPSHEQEPFCVISDILSSCYLDDRDKTFIRLQISGDLKSRMTRKQRWIQTKRIRHKLTRSGYGT